MQGDTRSLERNLRGLYDFGVLGNLSDGELIERAAARATLDSGIAGVAFEVLVCRHGPMVLRVCRLHLHDPHDVEDAFQATFLILARRMNAIRSRGSVASWLHGVAIRVASRSRCETARRRLRENATDEAGHQLIATRPAAEESAIGDEASRLVEQEVQGLPGRYREVILLCYWEGLTQEEAALRLGCPIGTVRSRSARARDLLRTRLVRRGVTPSSAIATGTLLGDSALGMAAVLPRVPGSLCTQTVRICLATASGTKLPQVASGSILLLVHGILRSVTMVKVKTAMFASAVIALGFLTAGRGDQEKETAEKAARRPAAFRGRTKVVKSPPIGKEEPRTKARKGKGLGTDYVIEPPDVIVVEVLDALPGRPITGERLVRPDGKISLGFYGEIYVAGLTIPEAKEKVILHLRKCITDEVLGLDVIDESDPDGKNTKRVDPKESDRVYVDVASYNSKYYYVQGEVTTPSRLPITGNETILDAINFADGLTPLADRKEALLFRPHVGVTEPEKRTINLEEVLTGSDLTTNYQILPGDRLVVRRDKSTAPNQIQSREQSNSMQTLQELNQKIKDVEDRMKDLDRKLDRVLEKL